MTTKTRKTRKDKGQKRKPKADAKVEAAVAEAQADTRRSIVPKPYKVKYAAKGGTCGKRLNVALKAATTVLNEYGRETLDRKALVGIAKANQIDAEAYAHLNPGQFRMTIGNRLAAIAKGGERKVKIGNETFGSAAA